MGEQNRFVLLVFGVVAPFALFFILKSDLPHERMAASGAPAHSAWESGDGGGSDPEGPGDEGVPTVIARPESVTAEFWVVTDRPKKELESLLDRKAAAALLGPKHCGDEKACAAVRAYALDERVHLDIQERKDVSLPLESTLPKVAPNLSAEDRRNFLRRELVFVISVSGAAWPDQLPARTAYALGAAIAEKTNGFVYDLPCERLELAAAFTKRAITAKLGESAFAKSRMDVQYAPRGDGTVRIVTCGLTRLGSPDLEVSAATMPVAERLSDVLAAVGDLLVGGAKTSPLTLLIGDLERARGAVYPEDAGLPPPIPTTVRLKPAPLRAGNPSATMVIVVPEQGDTPDGYRDLAETFFGGTDEELTTEEDSSAIAERAQAAMPSLLARFMKLKADPQNHLLVQFPFPIPGDAGGIEHIWIEVTAWDEKTITGKISEDPVHVLSLRKGDVMTRPRGEVSDYSLQLADGGVETPQAAPN